MVKYYSHGAGGTTATCMNFAAENSPSFCSYFQMWLLAVPLLLVVPQSALLSGGRGAPIILANYDDILTVTR